MSEVRGGPKVDISYPLKYALREYGRVHHGRAGLLQGYEAAEMCEVFERLAENPQKNLRKGIEQFPWLTLVIGSGCLELDDHAGPGLVALVKAVKAALPASAATYASIETRKTLVAEYLASLHRLRVSQPAQAVAAIDETEAVNPVGEAEAVAPVDEAEKVTVSAVAAQLSLCTALVTKIYHQVRAAGPQAIGRWWAREEAVLGPDRLIAREIKAALIAPALEELVVLGQQLREAGDVVFGSRVASQTVQHLVDSVHATLSNEGAVRLEPLRALTEINWVALTRGSSIYPGWSEVLLRLTLQLGQAPGEGVAGRSLGARPHISDHTRVLERLKEIFHPPAKLSWNQPIGKDASDRDRFYRTAASILHAQVEFTVRLVDHEPHSRSLVPLPTTFVTSFDLELETALWRIGKPFWIVSPAHVADDSNVARSQLVWLAAKVVPEVGCALTTLTDERDWRVASQVLHDPFGLERREPIVVRLAGSPLLKIQENPRDSPELLEDLKNVGFDVDHNLQLLPAFIVDEYTSMRQSQAEVFWATKEPPDKGSSQTRGLPDSLTADAGPKGGKRVWLALGVQVDDAAIRQRVFSHISVTEIVRRFRSTGSGLRSFQTMEEARNYVKDWGKCQLVLGASDPEPNMTNEDRDQITIIRRDVNHGDDVAVRGLAVNRRVDRDEAAVLYWLGFDVVDDEDLRNFIPDLKHYIDHLAAFTSVDTSRPNAHGCALLR